jgi:uncharacterized sporulation protein YeaH/YhbH (DUF444 family)
VFKRLAALLRPERALVEQVEALTKRLTALEDVQLNRELQFEETRERIQRYLSRVAAIENKHKRDEVQHQPDPLQLAVLRSKFPRTGENGGS